MDTWIAFARGPLFRIALAVCLLGLAYRVGNTLWQIRRSHRQAGDKRLDTATVAHADSGQAADFLDAMWFAWFAYYPHTRMLA